MKYGWGMVALIPTVAGAQMRIPEPLDPATYRSPDGRTLVYVNPSDPDGIGPAFVSVSKGGKLVWSQTLRYTPTDVIVLDDGTLCVEATPSWGTSSLTARFHSLFAILDPAGKQRMKHVVKQQSTQIVDAPPYPWTSFFTASKADDLLLVGLRGEPNQLLAWHPSSGRPATVPPFIKMNGLQSVQDLHFVPDSPFIVYTTYEKGSAFRLATLGGQTVWSRKASIDKDGVPREELIRAEKRSFILKDTERNQLITFGVGSGIAVEEGRKSLASPFDQFPIVKLKELPPVTLREPNPTRPPVVRDVYKLASFGDNQLVFVRNDDQKIVVVDTKGELVREAPLPSMPVTPDQICWVSATTVALALPESAGQAAKLILYDLATRTARKLWSKPGFTVESLVRDHHGRIIFGGELRDRYSTHPEVHCLWPDGREAWSLIGDGGWSGANGDLEEASSLAVLSDNRVLVSGDDECLVLSEHGKVVSTLDWSNLPALGGGYGLQVFSTENAGFMVALDATLWRFSGKHKLIGKVKHGLPQYPWSMEYVALKTGLYASDGEDIYPIARSGQLGAPLGERPKRDQLRLVQCLGVSRDGRHLIATDRRTRVAHLFSTRDGSFVRRENVTSPSLRATATSRRPDGRWFGRHTELVFAQHGSKAKRDRHTVSFYTAEGKVTGFMSVRIPGGTQYSLSTLDARRFVIQGNKGLYAYSTKGRPLWHAPQLNGSPFLADGILYLWEKGKSVRRFRLPPQT